VVEHRVIDNASVLNVTLTQGELFSVTQLAMLGGANHFAYGATGAGRSSRRKIARW
jgi:hypothetical protein